MTRRFSKIAAVVSALVLTSLVACQSEPRFVAGDPDSEARAAALSLEYITKTDPSLTAGVDRVWVKRVDIDSFGLPHTRLIQTIDNIEVFGAEAIVHLDKKGKFKAFTDSFVRYLEVETTSNLTELEAIDLAVSNHGGWDSVTGTPQADLQILEQRGVGTLTYRVQLAQFEPGYQPAKPVVFIDANTGDQVWEYDNLASYQLADAAHETYDINHSTNTKKPYPPADSSDGTALQVHDNAATALAYYQSVHGRNSYDDNGALLKSWVHYDNYYVNAFWDGTGLTFGDGDVDDPSLTGDPLSGPLTTLDIVAHELSHGVTEHTADLVYSNESGALNEGTSDIMAAAVEAHERGNPSCPAGSVVSPSDCASVWLVGEDTWTPNTAGDSLRAMQDPAAEGSTDYYWSRYTGSSDNGGVHTNSGVANLFFYLLSEGGTHPRGKSTQAVTGVGIEAAALIWYRALSFEMTSSTNFAGAKTATEAAAADLVAEGLVPAHAVQSVTDAWHAVGVDTPEPVFDVTETQTGLSGTNGDETPVSISAPPAGYVAIRVAISGGSGDADLYVKVGGTVSKTDYDCRPYRNGNTESCEFWGVDASDLSIMLHAYSSYSNVTLTVSTYTPEPTGCTVDADCTADDGNACTDNACVAGTCQNVNNTAACDDGNACTSGDVCSGGTCGGTNNTDPCDDGDSCTENDTCSGGSCSGSAVPEDPSVCTGLECGTQNDGCYDVSCGSCGSGETCNASNLCEAAPTTETICDDGIDNDGDGLIDGFDTADCCGDPGNGNAESYKHCECTADSDCKGNKCKGPNSGKTCK